MIKQNQRILKALNILTDGLLVLLAYLLSVWLWLDVFRQNPNNLAAKDSFFGGARTLALVYACIMMILFAVMNLYSSSRMKTVANEVIAICGANALGIIATGAALYILRLEDFSRGVLLVFFITSSTFVSMKHALLHLLFREMRQRGYNQKNVHIVGSGELAIRFVADARGETSAGYHVNGYFAPAENARIEVPYKGDFSILEECLDSNVDEVIIALEPSELGDMKQVIEICEKCGTKASIIPFYNDIIPPKPTIEIIGKTKLINLRSNPLDNVGYAAIKRFFDVVGSALLLVLLSPLLLVVAAAVKLTSPGPVLFKQERVGLNKRWFMIYKFRSMQANNPSEKTGWSTPEDSRQTAVGKLIRKVSIDELPQLLNVIKGEMSLIGPRPEIPYYVEQFKEDVPLYMVKHQVRPGMTGWAQVHGYRGDTSIPKRIEHDIWYIENWSLWLDVKIMFMTVFGGWVNSGKRAKQEEPMPQEILEKEGS